MRRPRAQKSISAGQLLLKQIHFVHHTLILRSMHLFSLYLYSQKPLIIWEDSVCVDMLLKPAEIKGEMREEGTTFTVGIV